MSDKFSFPDVDEIGIETLEAISIATNFNAWMYKTILPWCSGNILEIGSGIGNISKHFIEDSSTITLTDIRDNYVNQLQSEFGDKAKQVFKLDLTDANFSQVYQDHLGMYDTVFALNVVEHIEDDNLAILNAKTLLKKNGHLVILVPAYQFMYNTFDTALEHFRRYNKSNLTQVIGKHLPVVHSQYFNAFGMLGWFMSGRVLKKKSIPVNQMKMYDNLLFIAKTIDFLSFNKFGLSVISVGQKI